MAVYFEPQSNRPRWYDYIAQAAAQYLGGAIQSHFDKSKQQRDYDFAQRAAEAEMTRKRGQIDDFHNYYDDDGAFDVRSNPSQFIENMMGASMWGIDPSVIKTVTDAGAAPMSFQTVDQGDRITAGGFDSVRGGFSGQEYTRRLNPDTEAVTNAQKYGYDSALRQALAEIAGRRDVAGINAGAARYGHDKEHEGGLAEIAGREKIAGMTAGGAPDIDGLVKLYPHLFDTVGDPRPGTENIAPLIQALIEQWLGGGQPGGAVPGGQPGGAGKVLSREEYDLLIRSGKFTPGMIAQYGYSVR